MTRRFLLTGGSGALGQELQKIAPLYNIEYWAPSHTDLDIEAWNVLSWVNKHQGNFSGIEGIVHCAAFTNVAAAETKCGRHRAIQVNIIGSDNMAGLALALGIKFIYISTDYVYPGDEGNYKEEDRVRPVNYYAMTKLAGEAFASRPDDLVIRTSFKPNKPWPYPKAFDDLYTSADYVDIIAPMITNLIVGKAEGVYNVGTERKTIYELARRRNPEIKPMSKNDIKGVLLPHDTSMDISKYKDFELNNM